jgi:hypothetical protein
MRTCEQVILNLGAMQFCGVGAVFHYSGLVKTRGAETRQHAIERRGRVEVDLCMEHSRVRFIDMEPALKTGQATMRRLEGTKLTLHCKACHSLFRFEPLRPVVVRGADEASQSNGYFPVPSHFCPVGLTTTVYSMWMKDRRADGKFIDYIQTILRELDDAEK